MKVDRLLSAIEDGELYFATANQFDDPFEGAVAVMAPDHSEDPRHAEYDFAEVAFRELKRLTKINCWHCALHETTAMWDLYADQGKGVAVCSTPDRLSAALAPYRIDPEYSIEPLHGGLVRYVDLTTTRLQPADLERFYYKHRTFSWEQEFRLTISLRLAEEFGVRVPEDGILVSFDPSVAFDRIVLGPKLSNDDQDAIRTTVDSLRLPTIVARSEMLGRPRYV
ncbi:MAG: DUF2971 domain-containing protein [Deltaproteobacteria bacterium]|nr:DUF2971 domain-containing protein [Deltaproteobacteria bacterium]